MAHKPGTLLRPGRRAFCALAALAGVAPRLYAQAAPDSQPFALTSPARARALAATSAPAPSQQLLEQARAGLGREPHFLQAVHTSGLLDGEGDRDASKHAQEDWRQCRLQGLAYRLSGRAEHADCAARYLAAWAGPYRPSFNPVDETDLAALLYGFDLVQEHLPAAQAGAVRDWCRIVARGYLAQPVLNGARSTAVNNWHSHRVKLATAAAFASGDQALAEAAGAAFLRQVLQNIDDAGVTFDFGQRDALHYVVYTLEPLLAAAAMAAAHGLDWYGAAAAQERLPKALAWLLPYARGERTHQEFVRSSVAFDRRRAQAGVPGFDGAWRRAEAATLYWLAGRLDPRFAGAAPQAGLPPPWVQLMY